MARTRSTFCAPQAWPTSTLDPAVMPIRKAMKKKATGMKVAIEASACVPSIWPTTMLLIVMASDCRMFCPISGSRNTRKARHSGPV